LMARLDEEDRLANLENGDYLAHLVRMALSVFLELLANQALQEISVTQENQERKGNLVLKEEKEIKAILEWLGAPVHQDLLEFQGFKDCQDSQDNQVSEEKEVKSGHQDRPVRKVREDFQGSLEHQETKENLAFLEKKE